MLLLLDKYVNFFVKRVNEIFHKNFRNKRLPIISYSALPEIDIYIPVIEKDLDTLVFCIDGLKKNSLNPIKNFFIISPSSNKIFEIIKRYDLKWLDEKVLEIVSKESLIKRFDKKFMHSWIYQQLLKLNLIYNASSDYYLIMDADTILLQPQVFIYENGVQVLKYSDEFHFMYRKTNHKLIYGLKKCNKSFICHHQVINRKRALEMLGAIEQRSNKKWTEAILDCINNDNHFFSEYDLYGSFIYTFYPDYFMLQYWHNLNLAKSKIGSNNLIDNLNSLSKKYLSVSIHDYSYAK